MTENLKELVRKAIIGSCHFECALPFNFSDTKPLFIIIKNGQVSMSKEIDALDNEDACMCFFIYFGDNTVPDRYKKGAFVTFRNRYHSFKYVDSEGNVSYSFEDGKFEISGIWQSEYYLRLKFDNKELMSVKVTEENITHLWNCYQIAKKCVEITENDLNREHNSLCRKMESMTIDFNNLNERYKAIATSIKAIADEIEL